MREHIKAFPWYLLCLFDSKNKRIVIYVAERIYIFFPGDNAIWSLCVLNVSQGWLKPSLGLVSEYSRLSVSRMPFDCLNLSGSESHDRITQKQDYTKRLHARIGAKQGWGKLMRNAWVFWARGPFSDLLDSRFSHAFV